MSGSGSFQASSVRQPPTYEYPGTVVLAVEQNVTVCEENHGRVLLGRLTLVTCHPLLGRNLEPSMISD